MGVPKAVSSCYVAKCQVPWELFGLCARRCRGWGLLVSEPRVQLGSEGELQVLPGWKLARGVGWSVGQVVRSQVQGDRDLLVPGPVPRL